MEPFDGTGGGESAHQRYLKILEAVAADEAALRLLEKLIGSAGRYFTSVVEMESKLRIARLRLAGDAVRELSALLDQNRSYAHEALLADLHICNRYLVREFGGQVPVGGIFSKAPEAIRDRVAVADWAGELLTAIYRKRRT